MAGWFSVCLDGVPLDGISEKIRITDIEENAPEYQVNTAQNAKYAGSHVMGSARTALLVSVSFVIRERNIERRAAILDACRAWCKAGKLSVNYRNNQFLQVVPTGLPSATAFLWADTISLTFAAYDVPFWQESSATVCRAVNGAARITPPGNVQELRLCATLTAKTTVGSVTIENRLNGTKIKLDAISLAAGDVVEIGYTEADYLYINSKGNSLLANRTTDSSDDVVLYAGQQNEIRVTGDVDAVLYVRGRWA